MATELRDAIYSRGMTIGEFADRCGLSRWTINGILNRGNKPRGDTINLMAKVLKLPYRKVKVMCR